MPGVMPNAARNEDETPGWLEVVADQVQQVRFGIVQIVVHDSRVVQIERTEKVRLPQPNPVSSGQSK